jgi:hypothetical protein
MNQKNLLYLKDNLLFLGFGKDLYGALQKNIEQRFPEFILKQETIINDKPFSATLYFKKGEQSDLYFFNSWEAVLKGAEEKRSQTFHIHKGYGITFKEAFNLLEGRAVYKSLFNKEGEPYKAWLQLDLGIRETSGQFKWKQYHERYGFNLEKTLKALPLQELENGKQKERLLHLLQKGARVEVTLEKPGHIERLWVEAAPQFKSLNVYDHQGQLLSKVALELRLRPLQQSTTGEVTLLGKAVLSKGQQQKDGPFQKLKNGNRPSLF